MDKNFSQDTRNVLILSRMEALRLGNDFIGCDHISLAIIKSRQNIASRILNTLNPDIATLETQIEKALKENSGKPVNENYSLPLTTEAERVIKQANNEAKDLNTYVIEPVHLMLAIFKIKETAVAEFEISYDEYKESLSKDTPQQTINQVIQNDIVSVESVIIKKRELAILSEKKARIVKEQRFEEARINSEEQKRVRAEIDNLVFRWEYEIANMSYDKNFFDAQLKILSKEKISAHRNKESDLASNIHNWIFMVEKRMNWELTNEEEVKNHEQNIEITYNVFISKKESDYLMSKPVFNFLTSKKLKVFLSEESLHNIGNSNYMEEIDKALDEAKHMIILCTKAEFFNSPYVRAEWATFLNEKRAGRKQGNIISLIDKSISIQQVPIALRSFEIIKIDTDYLDRIYQYVKK